MEPASVALRVIGVFSEAFCSGYFEHAAAAMRTADAMSIFLIVPVIIILLDYSSC